MFRDMTPIIKQLKIFVIGSLVLFAITAGAIIYWVTQQAFNAKRITDAQVEVYKAQAEQVGKPQVIEQRYYSPQDKEVKGASAMAGNVLSLVNAKRKEKGLSALVWNQKIANGASLRAKKISSNAQWSHDGLSQALWNAGLRNWYSENLAKGFKNDPTQIVNAWVNSPTHAEKMFDERCTQAGIGSYGEITVLWMGVCGQPR